MSAVFSSSQGSVAVALLVVVAGAARGTWSPCGLSMISAINPFSERSRGHRYWMTALWFVVGSVAGGALLGAVGALGALVTSPVPPATLVGLAAVCCLVTLAADSPSVALALPLIPRQVNERWLSGYRRWVYASGFGAQIGVGLATYVMTGAVYLTPLLGALSGSPSFAVMIGLLFGLVRGLAILLSSRSRSPAQLRALHSRLAQLEPWSLRVVMLAQAGAALSFAAAAGGTLALLAVAVILVAGLLHGWSRMTVHLPRRSVDSASG